MGYKAPCGEVPVLEAHSSCLKEDREAGVEERLEESVKRWSLDVKLSRGLRDSTFPEERASPEDP